MPSPLCLQSLGWPLWGHPPRPATAYPPSPGRAYNNAIARPATAAGSPAVGSGPGDRTPLVPALFDIVNEIRRLPQAKGAAGNVSASAPPGPAPAANPFWATIYVSVEPFHLGRYLDEQAFSFNEREGDDGSGVSFRPVGGLR